MNLQSAIDLTRQELKKGFVPKQYKHRAHAERHARKEIRKAYERADLDTASREMFSKNPWFEMIEYCFFYQAVNKCLET